MTTILRPAMIVWLTPIRTVGMATGSCIHQSSWREVDPDILADSTISTGTRSNPSMTFLTIGGIA